MPVPGSSKNVVSELHILIFLPGIGTVVPCMKAQIRGEGKTSYLYEARTVLEYSLLCSHAVQSESEPRPMLMVDEANPRSQRRTNRLSMR